MNGPLQDAEKFRTARCKTQRSLELGVPNTVGAQRSLERTVAKEDTRIALLAAGYFQRLMEVKTETGVGGAPRREAPGHDGLSSARDHCVI